MDGKVETNKVKLSIDSSFITSEETFLGMFSPIRGPQVTLTFWSGDSMGREVTMSLQEAVYDDRTASLRGKPLFKITVILIQPLSIVCDRFKPRSMAGIVASSLRQGTILVGFFGGDEWIIWNS